MPRQLAPRQVSRPENLVSNSSIWSLPRRMAHATLPWEVEMSRFAFLALLGCAGAPVDGDELPAEWSGAVELSPPAGDLGLRILNAGVGGVFTVEVSGLDDGELVYLMRGHLGGSCPAIMGGVCLDLATPKFVMSGRAGRDGVVVLTREVPDDPLPMCVEAAVIRGPDGVDSATSGVTCGVMGTCDPASDVEIDGRCYYLDGSAGVCDPGYDVAPQSVLGAIAPAFEGKDYKHTVSNNCCIQHRDQDDELQDWGMTPDDCNVAGPFRAGPELGAMGCTDILNAYDAQLTLCGSL